MSQGRAEHGGGETNNNENQNQLNSDYMRQMDRIDAGIYQFKKDYEIKVNDVRQPRSYGQGAAMAPAGGAHLYDNAQDFLGDPNVSGINPAQSDMNLLNS